MKAYIVGGAHKGKIVNIGREQKYLQLSDPSPLDYSRSPYDRIPATATYRTSTYRRTCLRGGQLELAVLVPDNWDDEYMVQELLDGYHKGQTFLHSDPSLFEEVKWWVEDSWADIKHKPGKR